jgi:hypothetical protein
MEWRCMMKMCCMFVNGKWMRWVTNGDGGWGEMGMEISVCDRGGGVCGGWFL